MIFCKELNQEFATKAEMFAALKLNAEKIIGLKKASIKESDPIGYVVKGDTTKADGNTEVGIGSTIYAVINTTNWLDSHGDVHLNGIWDNSIKDQKNKLYYIINHDLEIGSVIAYPKDVEAYVEPLQWGQLGLNYSGDTQALMFKVLLTESANKDALNAIIGQHAIQNSVRMGYVSMTLCIDDPSDDFKQEYANFYKYLPIIANKETAIEQGYFWAISEAKIVKEGSAVLFGSNESTPILYNDPADAGQKQEQIPPVDTRVTKSNIHHLI